jgi:hypothetical protein
MATWIEFANEAPDVAALAERRLTATGLLLLATLRGDGFPRISPVEPAVDGDRLVLHDGYLHMGMMGGSTKALDLRRDPRCALHTATADKQVSDGDAKFWARGVEVTSDDDLERIAEGWKERTGWRPAPGTFHVFLADLLGASSVQVRGDVMFVETWKPGQGTTVVEKRE